ncbi:monofunctional biosynthetic peptidoglycan transglycosylase, partial [Mesorhizobium sp. M1D.F.Ca.ET.234.01.1.1]
MTEPIVEYESEGLDMARRRRLNRAGMQRIARRCLVVALVLAAIPVVLTFLYLPSFVHPIS